jgi:hypothetical protein
VKVAVADAKLCAFFLSIDQLHHEWHEKKYKCSTPSAQLLKKIFVCSSNFFHLCYVTNTPVLAQGFHFTDIS